jgi:hypothetical protein
VFIFCLGKRNILKNLIPLEAINLNTNIYVTKFTYFLWYKKIL